MKHLNKNIIKEQELQYLKQKQTKDFKNLNSSKDIQSRIFSQFIFKKKLILRMRFRD